MISWTNYDELSASKKLEGIAKVNLPEVMAGTNGADRVAIKRFLNGKREGDTLTFHFLRLWQKLSVTRSLSSLPVKALQTPTVPSICCV